MDEAPLRVVEGEAEVRWQWESGRPAVTRRALRDRLRRLLLPGVTVATDLEARLALEASMTRLAGRDGFLAAVHERAGNAWQELVDAMRETLGEAHRMTWHAALTREGFAVDARAATVSAAGRELARALDRAGRIDPESLEGRIATALTSADTEALAKALGARHVVASGIASFVPSELALWRALDAKLSRIGGSASIELFTFDRPFDAERAADPLGRLVDAVAEALDAAPRTRPIAPVLGDLGGRGVLAASPGKIELVRADGVAAEARAIASAVREALSDGCAPDAIAIVTPDGAPVRAALPRVLEEMGVPVHLAPEDRHPGGGLVAAVFEALAVAGRGAPRLGVAATLRSPYLDARTLTGLADGPAARAAVAELARSLERTRSASGSGPADALARTVLGSDAADPDRRSRLASLARRVGEVFEEVAAGSRRTDHAARTRRFLDAMGFHPLTGPGAAEALAGDHPLSSPLLRAEVDALVRDARAMKRLEAALGEYGAAAAAVESGDGCDFETFRLELARAVRAPVAGDGEPPPLGAVRVGHLRTLPSRPLALLVFAGAQGSALDAAPAAATLLDAVARARLVDTIEPALRPSVFTAPLADAIRLAAAAHGAGRLVLSYTLRDDEGARESPLALIPWLAKAGARETTWRNEIVPARPLTAREARLASLRRARAGSDARAILPHAAARAEVEWRRERAFGLARPGDAASTLDPAFCAAARSIVTEATGGAGRAMSVSALDRFGACRFQGFASQVLGARARPVLSEVMGPREEGTVLHGALAAAFDATRALWPARPRDAGSIRREARRATSEFLAPDRAASRQMRAALDEIADRVAGVVEWSLADDTWDFAQAEASFGRRPDSWAAVVLGDPGTALCLSGSIDRVDTSPDRSRLRVVDYKRSEDGARRLTDELGVASFQLAIYARASSEALGRPVATGAYLPTRHLPPTYRTRGSDAAWARAHADEAGVPAFERRALDLVAAVRRGDVDARPSRPDACRYCDHDGACRKPRFVIESALADEPDEPAGVR